MKSTAIPTKANQEIAESLREIGKRIYQPAVQIETLSVLIEAIQNKKIDTEVGPGLSTFLKNAAKQLLDAWDYTNSLRNRLDSIEN